MSMGYGGSARIILQDEKTVLYEYAPYNLNEPQFRNEHRIYDGMIVITKKAMVEPEIHKKVKKMPSGKKTVTKRIHRDINYSALLKTGEITVENSVFCWEFVGDEKNIGMIAMKIIFRIFEQYQDAGLLPKSVSINC